MTAEEKNRVIAMKNDVEHTRHDGCYTRAAMRFLVGLVEKQEQEIEQLRKEICEYKNRKLSRAKIEELADQEMI